MKKVAVSLQYVCYLQLHFHSASTLVPPAYSSGDTHREVVSERFPTLATCATVAGKHLSGIMAGECIVHPFVFHLLLFECINCKIIIIIKCETRAKFLDNVVICPRGNACRVCDYIVTSTEEDNDYSN